MDRLQLAALTPGPSPTDVGEGSDFSPLPRSGTGAEGQGGSAGAAAEIPVAELIADSGLGASEARSLLAFALDTPRESLIAHPQRPVAATFASRFRELCRRRSAGEPMAYLLGEREFFGRRFRVDRSVLIPRPETESLVEAALRALEGVSRPRVIDLGTGSGCIAVTLALKRTDARVWATEVSAAALELAQINAARLGARVTFLRCDWYGTARGPFDLIVSNPPYIAADDPHLAALASEPRGALTDGGDGLTCLRAIVEQADAYLAEQGALLVEHGYDQGAAVRALMLQNGFRSAQTLPDLAGLDRLCLARRA